MRGLKNIVYLAAILAVCALTVWIVSFAQGVGEKQPELVLPSPASGADEEETNAPEREPMAGDVTAETVQAVISTLGRAGDYIRQISFIRYWDGGSAQSDITVYARGDQFRVVDRNETDVTNILILGEDIWIWQESPGKYFSGRITDSAFEAADGYMRMVTYEHLLELPTELIIDAGFVNYLGQPCVYVEYVSSQELGYISQMYISVENGLTISEETYDGEMPVYKTMAESTEITTPSDEIMSPPIE